MTLTSVSKVTFFDKILKNYCNERVTTLINNQAKKLALLSIFKTGTKHRDV